MPPAPPTFSTMTDCSRISPIRCANSRAGTSLGPPAAKGLIMVSARVGQSCADDGRVPSMHKAATAATSAVRILLLPLNGCGLCREHALNLVPDRFLLGGIGCDRQRQIDRD